MFKTDECLRSDVLDELHWDYRTRSAGIGVAVLNGVVALFGEVSSEAEKRAAIAAVERVSAVRAIAEHIVVRIPGSLHRSDADIAREVARILDGLTDLPDSIKARVEDGWLWLEGEVEWPYQRSLAERAVLHRETGIAGLRGITNDVVVARPGVLPAVVEHERGVLS